MSRIRTETWRTLSHVTGPSAVLVSLKFGTTPDGGPVVTKSIALNETDATVKFDVERYVAEVADGVREANEKYAGSLQIEAIRIVPSDYPHQWQVKYVAYLIARHAITGENWG